MIICDPLGGIGNLLFQIAATQDMGRRSGIPVCYPNVDKMLDYLYTHYFWMVDCRDYPKLFKNLDWYKNADKYTGYDRGVNVPFHYVEITPEPRTYYKGYFQSGKYFDRQFTLNLFEPSEFLENLIPSQLKGVCSIHVRRNNYLKLKHEYHILEMGYYEEAMEIIKAERYFVFSDDIEWCRANFKGDKFSFMSSKDYIDMFTMSRCEHNIMANSSFSWWGAYLNQNPDKKVIAPKKWFTTDKYTSRDIYCDDWMVI